MTAVLAWIAAHALTIAAGAVPGIGSIVLMIVRGVNPIAFLSTHRSYITLIVVGCAAAALWAWGATGRADRAELRAWADTVCASAGSEFEPAKGKRGAACQAAIADLARYKLTTTTESARILAQAASDREAKAARDADRARQLAADTRAAAEAMEKTNANVTDDRAGGDWFAALNHLAGLRPAAR